MIVQISKIISFVLGVLMFSLAGAQAGDAVPRPNILLVLADDLGYTDIGAFGSEIATPTIDALAGEGVMLTNFRAGPACGPTRAMLLSGVDNHLSGIGVNKSALVRLEMLRGVPGYEGYLNHDVVTFVRLLQDSGYRTYVTGKWHVGSEPGYLPPDRGFDRSFVMLQGGVSHFSDMRGLLSSANPSAYSEDGDPVDKLPDNFFSSTFYADQLIEYIDADRDSDAPFFAYLSFTAPHWPLQVPDDWLDRYEGRYDDGWDSLRRERFVRLQKMGLIAGDAMYPPRDAQVRAWESLRPIARQVEARRMELYAAMVENMDYHLGRVINYLKESDQYRNTLIVFMSDNGAEGNDIGNMHDNAWWVPANFDNRLTNMGRVGSYVWVGNGWSQASVTPGRMYKSYVSDGGIRTPAIVAGGALDTAPRRTDVFTTVMDIAPTLLDVAGVNHPVNMYHDKPILPLQGKSMLPHLAGSTAWVHDADEMVAFESYGSRAVFMDRWKLLWLWPPSGPGRWELFDLSNDPGETHDVSADYPDVVTTMKAGWAEYVRENNIYEFDRDVGYGRYR